MLGAVVLLLLIVVVVMVVVVVRATTTVAVIVVVHTIRHGTVGDVPVSLGRRFARFMTHWRR